MTSDQLKKLEATLWQSADMLRSNAGLKASEYSTPILGLIFLRFADNKYSHFEREILKTYQTLKGTRREKPLHEIAVEKCGFYLAEHARYDYLLNLPEEEDIAKAIKQAMVSIEEYKPELKDVLPQDEYFRLVSKPEDRVIPKKLLKNFADIPRDATGDMFGQIYEYFLGKFALAEGQGGGEFFTPRSVVRLMVEIIEPHQGTVFDPACGSGGMFVQSAHFVEQRTQGHQGDDSLFVYGQEMTLETVKLAKMNLAVNGLRGEIKQANIYYDDEFDSIERFDYVLTNPPFNADEVSLNRVENDPRFSTYGIPRNKTKAKKKGDTSVPNANYLWINLFATSLEPTGRAGLVMANSASDARHSEADIRRTLIEHNLIYANPRYYGGDHHFIKTPDMHGRMYLYETQENLTEEGIQSQPSQSIPHDSICVSCIGTGGVVSITTATCQTNQQINSVVLEREFDLEWAYFTIRGLKETIKLFGATGTTMTNLSKGKFSKLKVIIPDKEARIEFHRELAPLFSQIQFLTQGINTLIQSRDLLLPRLISGKLDVEKLSITFPAGMLSKEGAA